MRALLASFFLALAPGSAAAEIFRCVQADGSVLFSDSGACPSGAAKPHAPRGQVQRSSPAARAKVPTSAGEASGAAPPVDAESALLDEAQLGPGWSAVEEAPERLDEDLRRWGVRDKRARHYTRDAGGRVQVCSIEVWIFEDAERAGAAHAGFAYPDWRILREGSLLVMLRGLSTERGAPPRRGVFPDCEALGARIRALAAASP